MNDDEIYPCEDCGCECDAWEMQACCILCRWHAGTDDSEILGCNECTRHDDI